MANRAKEDEKNEKIIRALLKLPANRRCINCNNLGPQYVCINFWTFVCTNCSGMHREFTHRVKSISMAKFTSQEVSALQEGGNKRAKEIYFKDWDPQRYSFPDCSNMDRLREFIKHVYVDRRYSGGRQGDRPQGLKGDRDDSNENRKAESYRGGSRSPPYEGRYNTNYGSGNDVCVVKYVYGERSPGYDRSRHKRSPVHFEVVDDRVRDDKFRNTSQNRRLPDAPKSEGGRSPNHQKDVSKMSPPMVRPVRDILGDNVPQLQVGGSSTTKSNGTGVPDDSAQMKTTLSSSSISSTDANSEQLKGSLTESLIDFDADPGPPVSAKSEQSVPQQTANVTDNGGDWAAFDITGQKIAQMASNTNPLVTALAELSVSESSPAGYMQTGFESKPTGGGNLPTVQQQQSLVSPPDDNPSSNQPPNAPVIGASNNQTWMPSPVPYGQGSFTGSTVYPEGHLSLVTSKPTQVATAGVSSQLPFEESKSSGRKELPVDFFTSLYPNAPVSAPAPGWQTGLYPGFGYNMHLTGVAMPPSVQTSKSVNPFDLTGDPAPTFLPVPAPQAALQNMTAPGALPRTSGYGALSPSLVSSQQSPYVPNVSPSPFTFHQIPNDMHQQSAAAIMSLQNQGFAGPAVGTIGIDQHPSVRFPQPGTPNSFGSVGGNPFG